MGDVINLSEYQKKEEEKTPNFYDTIQDMTHEEIQAMLDAFVEEMGDEFPEDGEACLLGMPEGPVPVMLLGPEDGPMGQLKKIGKYPDSGHTDFAEYEIELPGGSYRIAWTYRNEESSMDLGDTALETLLMAIACDHLSMTAIVRSATGSEWTLDFEKLDRRLD